MCAHEHTDICTLATTTKEELQYLTYRHGALGVTTAMRFRCLANFYQSNKRVAVGLFMIVDHTTARFIDSTDIY